MSEEVANKLLRATVAQLLLPIGWHNITNTSIQVLVDVMKRYIEGVGKMTGEYAEHGNRNLCNLDDLAMAFDEYQIRLPSLQEYFNGVDHLPFPHEVFQFPVKRCSKHVYESSAPPTMTRTAMIGESSDEDDDEVLSPLIPAYLPPLPTQEETRKADDDEDKESGIHVSDVEEMEIGVVEGNTPVEGQIPKGLPGMASSGRRGRTFSTDSDLSSEHDDQTFSKTSSTAEDVAKQLSAAVVPTRVVPHRINPIRLSEVSSPDPIVTPHDDEVSVSGVSLDDSSLDSNEEIEVEDKVVPVTSKAKKTKSEVITEDEASLQASADIIPEKKVSKKQQKSPSTPAARIIAKSETTKEASSGPYKPTVSSKLLTRFTMAKDIPTPEGEDDKHVLPQAGRLPEPPPPLNLKSVPHESKVSLSSLSPLSSDISSPRSPVSSKNMQLTLEKLPMESPTKRSYKLDSLSPLLSPTTQDPFPVTNTSKKDDLPPLLSPTITTNSEDDSDVSALSPKLPVPTKKESKLPKPSTKTGDASFSKGLGDKRSTHKAAAPKTATKKDKLVVSIDRKYISLPQRDAKPSSASHKKKSKTSSDGLRSMVVSIPKQYYFHTVASQQKPKRPQTLSPAIVKQDRKTKVKSALAEDRVQPMASSRDIDASPRLPVVTPADTPLSQPLKLRFKLSSDVVGESSVSPDVSKDTLAPSSTPMDWSAGGHSSHKKKRRHKKEKKKKKKKYHDSDSSSDSEGIYSEGNSAKNSPMPTGHMTSHVPTTSHVLPPLATTVLPYQPAYPPTICPTCKLPDDGRPMIACDICDRWFHWACVNVVTEPQDGMDWYCPECSRDNMGNGSSKRKEHKHKKKKKHSHDHD